MKQRLFAGISLAALFAIAAHAQLATTMSLVGTVSDASGKVLFNHPNFGNPSATINTSSFGDITSATGNRTIQFAAKLQF